MNGSELDQIVAFLAAVDHGGFTAAERALGRDGSVLSRRVTALEKRLGVRLLERTTRRIALTEAGATFYRRMRLALQTVREIEQETAEAAPSIRGRLRLSLPSTFGRMWITPILPQFLSEHPDLALETRYEDRYVDLVAESFDVAVRIGELDDSQLIARKLASTRRLLCASPNYLATKGCPGSPVDLAYHDCLGFVRLASHPVWHLHNGTKSAPIRIAGPLMTDDAESLIRGAVVGLGIAMATDWLAGPELHSGELVPVLPDWTVAAEEAIYAVHPSARLVPAKTRVFVDWLAGKMAEMPWLNVARH